MFTCWIATKQTDKRPNSKQHDLIQLGNRQFGSQKDGTPKFVYTN